MRGRHVGRGQRRKRTRAVSVDAVVPPATPTAARRPWWQLAILACGIVFAVAACHGIAATFGATGMVGPLAASAFLVTVMPGSPMASPRAVIAGHVLGVASAFATGWLVEPSSATVAIAPGVALVAMLAARSAHAPAAATPVVVLATGIGPSAAFGTALCGACVVVAVGALWQGILHGIDFRRALR